MAKISFGGYDDGEGSSNNPSRKRRRVEPEDNHQQEQGSEVEEDQPSGIDVEDAEHRRGYDGGNEERAPPGHETVGSNADRGDNSGSATDDRDRSISVTITDPDVLDCCICYEPLSTPVFQCENGHIACSSCCARLGNKCPMCSMPIGYNRCRAIEKVLETIKISCLNAKYGCKEKFSYCRKIHHEKECFYLPCSCPHSGCNFVASSQELSLHFSNRHRGSGLQFIYDKFFTIFLNIDHKAIVLQEKDDANLFVVHNNHEFLGNLVHITCIGPKSRTGFHYDILARSQGNSLILQSFTKIIQGQFADVPSTGLLLIPSHFFGSGPIKLDIRIRSQLQTLSGDQRSSVF